MRERALMKEMDPNYDVNLPPSQVALLLIANLMVLFAAIYVLAVKSIPRVVEEKMAQIAAAKKLKETLEKAKADFDLLQSSRKKFDEIDANHDGNLSREEWAVKRESDFDEYDVDGNGVIDFKELLKKEAEEADEHVDEQIRRLFARYDLDGTGTINTFDELEQICCNLGYRLELDLKPTKIDEAINQTKDKHGNIDWDVDFFSVWFKATFMARRTN